MVSIASLRAFAVGHVSYRHFGELVPPSLGCSGIPHCHPSLSFGAFSQQQGLMLFQATRGIFFFAKFLPVPGGQWGLQTSGCSPGFDSDPCHGFGEFLCSWLFLKANVRQSRRRMHKNNTNQRFVIRWFVAACELSFAVEQAGKGLIQVSGRTCAAGAGPWPNPPSLHLSWIQAKKTTTPLWQNHLQLQVC